MASKTAHGTLTANAVTTVEISNHGGAVEIVNRSGTGTMWVRFDGTNPVIGAQDNYVVVGARRFDLRTFGTLPSNNVFVKIISSAALDYSVEGGGA